MKFGLVSGIYAIVHLGVPRYIGSSVNCYSRYGHHVWALCNNRHRCKGLQALWDLDADLDWLILEECAEQDLLSRENHWLRGYANVILNASPTATGAGRTASEATRQKLSRAHKGRVITPEWRERISKARKGQKPSPEAVEKMRAALTGKKLSDEHKRKIGVASALRKDTLVTREKKRQAALVREANRRNCS